MKPPLFRVLTLSVLLLGMFLTAMLALEWWFQRETRRQLDDMRESKQAQLAQALALLPRPPDAWDDAFKRQLGAMLDGRVQLDQGSASATEKPLAGNSGHLAVTQPLPGHTGYIVHLDSLVPATHRLATLNRRLLMATVVVGLLLVMVPLLFILPPRDSADGRTNTPWQKARAEIRGLTHYARISEERGAELERETGARRRAEEDLQVNRSLLNQAQEERAQLGRELHDNICQTLYAVSLTLESVSKKIAPDSEPAQRLAQCQKEVKRLNQEVRAYLRDLEPDEMSR
ncbi:MAG TPA: histidine kinase, partial [Candidatus Didemnitutus sp.]|nr:histidine kinase [Candidatus Didemnitutus sp.]